MGITARSMGGEGREGGGEKKDAIASGVERYFMRESTLCEGVVLIKRRKARNSSKGPYLGGVIKKAGCDPV